MYRTKLSVCVMCYMYMTILHCYNVLCHVIFFFSFKNNIKNSKMKEEKKLILFIDFILHTFENLSFIIPLKGIPSHLRLLYKVCAV